MRTNPIVHFIRSGYSILVIAVLCSGRASTTAGGGGAARYWVGLYGGGQPILRVQGKTIATDKSVFNYEMRRSGVSRGARMVGAFMKDEDIQLEDIRSLVLDLTDFMAAVEGKYASKQ